MAGYDVRMSKADLIAIVKDDREIRELAHALFTREGFRGGGLRECGGARRR